MRYVQRSRRRRGGVGKKPMPMWTIAISGDGRAASRARVGSNFEARLTRIEACHVTLTLHITCLLQSPLTRRASARCARHLAWTMRASGLLAALSACLLATVGAQSTQDTLAKLAASNNGVINLDTRTYGLLSSPNRDWSFSVQFTALDKKRRCAPCKCAYLTCLLPAAQWF